MNALLLAAGFGSRLGAITEKSPKCLVKVGAQTMLDHWIYKLDEIGVEQFFINTHYKHELVEQFIALHPLKDRIQILYEPELLGTAGTVKRNHQKLCKSDCLIVHVDNYCADDLTGLIAKFNDRPKSVISTMLVFHTSDPQNCGVVVSDKNGIMQSFHEKVQDPPSHLGNGAVYLVSTAFFEFVNGLRNELHDLSIDVLPRLSKKINLFETVEFFVDMGTPQTLRLARKHHQSKKGGSPKREMGGQTA